MESYLLIGYGLTLFLFTKILQLILRLVPASIDDEEFLLTLLLFNFLYISLFNRTCSPPRRVLFLAVSSLLLLSLLCCRLAMDAITLSRNRHSRYCGDVTNAPPSWLLPLLGA